MRRHEISVKLCVIFVKLCVTLRAKQEGYTEFHKDHTEFHRVPPPWSVSPSTNTLKTSIAF